MVIKNRTLGYSAIQGFFWMGYASIMGFASVFLLNAGFDNGQVGLLIAAAGLLSALLQPLLAAYADRPGSMALKWVIFLLTLPCLGCSLVLTLAGTQKLLAGGCFGLCMVLLQLTTPLVNSLGIATVNSGEPLNFGAARAMGSLGYGVAAYLIGLLTDSQGAAAVPLCMGTTLVLLLIVTLDYRNVQKAPPQKAAEPTQGGFLRRYPRYGLVLVGLVFLFVSHVVLNSFTYQIVVSKGGDNAQMGTAMAFASVLELPIMFLFGWMQKKWRCHVWFRISGLFFLLKTAGTLLCSSMTGFFAVQLFQMGGWALLTVSSVFYINSIMQPQDSVKGQACYTTSMTLGNVLGAVVAGRILDVLGVQAMLAFGTVCALIGAVIVLVFTQKTE